MFTNFTIGMIRNKSGHLLKGIKRQVEKLSLRAKHILRRNIAASSLEF